MKATILSEKGTSSKQVDVEPSQWVGREFYVVQEKVMSDLPKGTIISLGKGTAKIFAGEYPKRFKKISSSGVIVTTNKGTSSYRLP
jgi:hypothetical protein